MSISTSISNSFKTSIASCITGKSLVLPIIIPTLLIDFLIIVYVVFFLINLSIFLRLRSAEPFEVTLFANHPNAVLYSFRDARSEEHTSELQSRPHLVCRLLLEKKKTTLIY